MQRGFSMVEAMTVLAIIVLLGSVSIPSIRSGLSHLKLARAVDTFVNQVEFARSQAASRNRAYRLQIILGQGQTRGRVIVTEGWNTICNQTSFEVSGGFQPVDTVRDINFTNEHPWVMITGIVPDTVGASSDNDYTGLCFKPDGRVMGISSRESGDGGFPVSSASAGYSAGEALFVLTLIGEGSQIDTDYSPARTIIVPYNGVPRVENGSAVGGS